MKVLRHIPPRPEPTHDIVGLTPYEMLVIRHALMCAGEKRYTNAFDPDVAADLHHDITCGQNGGDDLDLL